MRSTSQETGPDGVNPVLPGRKVGAPCSRALPRPSTKAFGPAIFLFPASLAADPSHGEITVEADAPAAPGAVTTLPLGGEVGPGADLGSVLEGAAGTTVRRLGGLGSFVGLSVRGSTFRQVEVLIDGVPLNPDGAGAVDLSELPVGLFASLDLYRGYSPSELGSLAMGGVIDLHPPPGEVPAAVAVAAGSWELVRIGGQEEAAWEGGSVLLSADHLQSGGRFAYFDDQGTEYNLLDDRTSWRENNEAVRTAGLGRLRQGPLTLVHTWNVGHLGLPGSIAAPTLEASYRYQRNLVSLSLAPPPTGRLRWSPRAWWLYRRDHTENPEAGLAGASEVGHYHTAGVDLPVAWAPLDAWSFSAAGGARVETFAPFDLAAEAKDGVRARLVGAAHVAGSAVAWDGRVRGSAGVHARVLANQFLGEVPFEAMPVSPESEDLEAYVLPRVGVVVSPVRALSLRANAGLYVRPPDFVELFGNQGMIVGNTELVPERSSSVELGGTLEVARSTPASLTLDVAYARRRVHDLITYEPNSQRTQHAVNLGEVYVRTLEAGAALRGGTWFTSTTTVTSTLGRNLDPDPAYANNALPNLPPWEVGQVTTLHVGPWAELAHTWSYTGPTWVDAANSRQLPARDLHAVSVDLHPRPGLPTLRFEVLNLLDVRGVAVDRNPYADEDDALVMVPLVDFAGYPLPGRTFVVGLSWRELPRGDQG